MSTNESESVVYRDVAAGDAAFIMSTWLKGLRYGNDWFGLIPAKIYFLVYHKVIETILSRPNVKVKVACLKSDPDIILGYSVSEGCRLDWIHVKKAWRSKGIAKALSPKELSTVSHLTNVGRSILSKNKKVCFNPFL